jgi:outer membrane biosynthesis protein TonB
LRTALQSERHLLTGKIDFDKEGNILRIKILRSSPSDEVHQLFEETLKEIRSLPNPPKALVENREQFTIYYQLNINY